MARIIYVEDDDIVGDLVKQSLTEIGHVIGVIDHGLLAFETIVFKQPDLILLDCALPGMKGVEILRRVRAIPEIYLTPVVMLTADASAEAIDAAMGAGANDYIVKPVTIPALIERIEAVLRNSFYNSKVSSRVLRAGTPAAPVEPASHLDAANAPPVVTAK